MSRNSLRAFRYFDRLLSHLQRGGYELVFLSELYDRVASRADLPVVPLTSFR